VVTSEYEMSSVGLLVCRDCVDVSSLPRDMPIVYKICLTSMLATITLLTTVNFN